MMALGFAHLFDIKVDYIKLWEGNLLFHSFNNWCVYVTAFEN